jgi:hypothetical protein
MQSYGPIKNVTLSGTEGALIQFEQRHVAEAAFGRGKVLMQGVEIPLSWHAAPATTGGASSTTSSSSSSSSVDVGIQEVFDRPNPEEDTVYSSEDEERSWRR